MIFISHSSQDQAFTRWLVERLRAHDLAVWVDLTEINSGERWLAEIQSAIDNCDQIVVVLSNAARQSRWVERETIVALERGIPLHIALIDEVKLPLQLADRQYLDFRQDREAALKKLLVALDAKPKEPERVRDEVISPEPTPDNFFKYLAQFGEDDSIALVALDLYHWAQKHTDAIEFSGKIHPAFHARLQLADGMVRILTVVGFSRTPKVQIPLSELSAYPPYHKRKVRTSTLRSLNRLLPEAERMDLDRADRLPTLSIHPFLESARHLEKLKSILEEIIENLHSQQG